MFTSAPLQIVRITTSRSSRSRICVVAYCNYGSVLGRTQGTPKRHHKTTKDHFGCPKTPYSVVKGISEEYQSHEESEVEWLVRTFPTNRRIDFIKMLEWIPVDKVNWMWLAQNPNVTHLLEKNLDRVDLV